MMRMLGKAESMALQAVVELGFLAGKEVPDDDSFKDTLIGNETYEIFYEFLDVSSALVESGASDDEVKRVMDEKVQAWHKGSG